MSKVQFVRALLAGIGLLALACGTPSATAGAGAAAGPVLTWPVPPDQPRIRFVRTVHNAAAWGIEKSLLRRLVEKFTGAEPDTLVRPTGVAASEQSLYVADPGAKCLWIFDGKRQRALRVTAAGADSLVSPVAVATRGDGAVFVADSALGKVFLFSRDGDLVQALAGGALVRPAGLAYDSTRELLYVADPGANLVTTYDARGAVVRVWGGLGTGDGMFNRPTHIAVTATGTVLVTDALNFRVQAFDSMGIPLWKFGRQGDGSGDFAAPKGVGMDSAGHVYVVDALFDAVQVFGREGDLLLAIGQRGKLPGQFSLPNGIFVDVHDRIYVADAYNGRIQVFDPVTADGGTKP